MEDRTLREGHFKRGEVPGLTIRIVDAIEMNGKTEARVQIERFVDENPEAVAQLLRNWLTEDWE